jgi:hypothetical protein
MRWILLFLSSFELVAMVAGNPAQPALLQKGLFSPLENFSFRPGYLDDWVYDQKFRDIDGLHASSRLSTYAALLTFNFANRLDLYGIVGSSRMKVDEEIFTTRALAWGVGLKWVLFQHENFFIGWDFKYFTTEQKPRYFVIEGEPYNIVSAYHVRYEDVQTAFGVAYRTSLFVPYANVTYISSQLTPVPSWLFLRFPDGSGVAEMETGSTSSKQNWGLALGLTLVDTLKMSLSAEWRGLNQNAVDVNGEVRF